MSLLNHLAAVVLVNTLLIQVRATDVAADKFDILMERMEKLEDNDRVNKLEIAFLKNKISEMEKDFEIERKHLLNEVNDLKSRLETSLDNTNNDDNVAEDEKRGNSQTTEDVKTPIRSISERAQVEDEVAFYATHTQHDVIHLGANQILPFEQTVVNKGNGYDTMTGAFTAPVAGTYVFHTTIMGGPSHNTSNFHFQAIIQVNNVPYSKMWVTFHDQSSQMLIIDLEKGSVVTIRNVYTDEGFVGQHYSTFSGFLLYQNFESTGSNIIG